jgi:hypothetical membrane protein
MTNKTTESSEYFECSKVIRPSMSITTLLIVAAIAICLIGCYFDRGDQNYGYALVLVPYFAVSMWCDMANINFTNTPRLKTLLSILSVGLTLVFLIMVR